jgi:hypothetical protein
MEKGLFNSKDAIDSNLVDEINDKIDYQNLFFKICNECGIKKPFESNFLYSNIYSKK